MNHTATPTTTPTTTTTRLMVAAVAIAALTGGGMVAHADPFSSRAYEAGASQNLGDTTAPAWPAVPSTCSSSPCAVTLTAGADTVLVKDATSGDVNGNVAVPFWGFGVSTTATPAAVGLAGTPQSVIKVPMGTEIEITLDQTGVGGAIDLSFPSLAHVVKNSATSYTVTADKVGTMVFQPGSNADAPRQIAMGLVGVLIVTPQVPATDTTPASDCASCAYNPAMAYQDEAVVAMSDLDLAFAHDPLHYDMSYFGQSRDAAQLPRQVYHLINGKSFPDTDVIDAKAGDNVLLRYVNAGVRDKNMGLLGLPQSLLARNAAAYTDQQRLVAPLVGPGETADVAVAIPADTPAGQKFSLMDQGRAMNHGSTTGFGGALTFIDVWSGTVPTVDAAAFDLATNVFIATGHPSDATHALTGYQFLVTDSPTAPAEPDWVNAVVSFVPAPAAGDPVPIAVDLTATPPTQSQYLWVRVQQGTILSTPVSVQVRIAPSVTLGGYDPATGMLPVNATPVAPATIVGYETAFSPTNVEPAAGTYVPAVTVPPIDLSANHGQYVWVRVTDSNGAVSTWASMRVPYDKPTVVINGYLGSTLTATAAADPLLSIVSYDVAVNSGSTPGPGEWVAGTGDPVNISETVTAASTSTVWVRVTDSDGGVSDPASVVVP